uniref:Uncharacterized protein n=1 Tax=Chenopodium quinoa TaxID=63459 RepID=A0A803L3L0_CHEQI
MRMGMKGIYRVIKFICSIEFMRMSLLWPLYLVFSHLRLFSGRHYSTTFPRQLVSNRPVCIVTGATSGLGAAATEALSKQGFFVILVGRSGHLLSKTMAEIRKQNEDAQLEAFEVDLSSFSSIMKLKNSLTQWLLDMNLHPSIQLLINNAGILATSYRPTDDVNDVQVDEELVYGKSFSNFKQYPFAQIYGCSKLCILLFSYELHRQFSKDKVSQLSINVADPGAVKTNIMREIPQCLSQLAFAVLRLLGILHFPEKGISSILDAALAPPETSGMYFFGGKGRTINSSPLSYNKMFAKRLWGTSCDIFQELKRIHEKSSISVCD